MHIATPVPVHAAPVVHIAAPACPSCLAAAQALAKGDPNFRAVAKAYPNIRMALCPNCQSKCPGAPTKTHPADYGYDGSLGADAVPGTTVTLTGSVTNPDGTITNSYSDGTSSIAQPGTTWQTNSVVNGDGSTTITWSDGSTTSIPAPTADNTAINQNQAASNAYSSGASASQVQALQAASAPGASQSEIDAGLAVAKSLGSTGIAIAQQFGLLPGGPKKVVPTAAKPAPIKPPAAEQKKTDMKWEIALGVGAALLFIYLVVVRPKKGGASKGGTSSESGGGSAPSWS